MWLNTQFWFATDILKICTSWILRSYWNCWYFVSEAKISMWQWKCLHVNYLVVRLFLPCNNYLFRFTLYFINTKTHVSTITLVAWGLDVPRLIVRYDVIHATKAKKVNLINCDTRDMARVAPEEPPRGVIMRSHHEEPPPEEPPWGATLRSHPEGATLRELPWGATMREPPWGATLRSHSRVAPVYTRHIEKY